MSKSSTWLRFPHPLVLLAGAVLLGAALSYVVPAGEYDRRLDPNTGRNVVVAGTYHRVDPEPVAPFAAVVTIPKGLADAADVVFLVFLIGGAFTVIDKTGALRSAIEWLARRLVGRERLVIPVVALFFAAGGALENMQEEIIAMMPVVLLITGRFGMPPMIACSITVGAAAVGSAFSPVNPFQVVIAQKLAELPLLSGAAFRLVFLAIALAFWIAVTLRFARGHAVSTSAGEATTGGTIGWRHATILSMVAAAFVVLVYGLIALEWDFDHLSALFFVTGVLAGLIGRLGWTGTAEAYIEGFRSMAFAAILIGFARAISVVLAQGKIIDTLVYALFTPIADMPPSIAALGMMAAHTAIHVPVPSVSGHAVLTMPVLVPLADLLGLSRQVVVLAYQYAAGLCEMVTPTNGALLAVLASAGVRFDEWLRWALPKYLALVVLGAAAVMIAVAIGL